MKGSFNRAVSYAINGKSPDTRLFKSRLYKRFTHRGAKRKIIYRKDKNNPNEYVKSKEYNWGNYLSYVYKADNVMLSINGDNLIKRQSRKLWTQFHKLILISENKINRMKNTRR